MISVFLATAGLSQASFILIAFPPLQRRLGTGSVLRICGVVWPVDFALWPICNILLLHHFMPAFYTLAFGGNFVGSGVSMAFSKFPLSDIKLSF
jgi:hypothetical protein